MFDDYEIPPHQSHSETSRAAALGVAHSYGKRQREHLEIYKTCGKWGLTDDEIQVKADIKAQSQVSIRRSLEKKGYIEKAKIQRPTRCGYMAEVYRVIDKEFNWDDFKNDVNPDKKMLVSRQLLKEFLDISDFNGGLGIEAYNRFCEIQEELRTLVNKGVPKSRRNKND